MFMNGVYVMIRTEASEVSFEDIATLAFAWTDQGNTKKNLSPHCLQPDTCISKIQLYSMLIFY
jgi:hypothetical protein